MAPRQQLNWELFLHEASREMGHRPIGFEIDLPLCRRRDGSGAWEGRAVNASRAGMLALLPVRIPEKSILSLEVQAIGRTLQAEARVVRLENPRADGLIPHGLAYVDPEKGSRLLLDLLAVGLF